MFRLVCGLVVAMLLVAAGNARVVEVMAPGGPSLIGIDHVPTVVADLDKASATYRRLGFALKPGRAHANGLRNRHVKFRDGSGIELIAVPAAPADAVTRAYAGLLRQGEGPAYLAFHARDTDALTAALRRAGIGFRNDAGAIAPSDPRLGFLFFVRDNRSPTDRPEHFAHPNGATAMTEVWLALDAAALRSLRTLLLALGAVESTQTVMAPARTRAQVFRLRNGRVVALAASRQSTAGRPIIGVRFAVPGAPAQGRAARAGRVVPPSDAHGMWLSFARPRSPGRRQASGRIDAQDGSHDGHSAIRSP